MVTENNYDDDQLSVASGRSVLTRAAARNRKMQASKVIKPTALDDSDSDKHTSVADFNFFVDHGQPQESSTESEEYAVKELVEPMETMQVTTNQENDNSLGNMMATYIHEPTVDVIQAIEISYPTMAGSWWRTRPFVSSFVWTAIKSFFHQASLLLILVTQVGD